MSRIAAKALTSYQKVAFGNIPAGATNLFTAAQSSGAVKFICYNTTNGDVAFGHDGNATALIIPPTSSLVLDLGSGLAGTLELIGPITYNYVGAAPTSGNLYVSLIFAER